MTFAIATAVTLLLGYLIFAIVRLGYVGRLSLLATWDDRIDRALEFAAHRHGKRELIELTRPLAWTQQQHWNAPQILDTVKKLSACWHHLGVKEGDRVAIYKANQFDYFLFSVAALRIGAIAVPINGNVAPEVALGYMERVGVTLLISDRSGWQKLGAPGKRKEPMPQSLQRVVLCDAPLHDSSQTAQVHSLPALLQEALPAAPECNRGAADPLYIVHTSGTTGVPKGVILKQEGIAQSLRSIVLFNPISTRDLACFALPLNHQVSHLYLHGMLMMGIHLILDDKLEAEELVRQLHERKPTVFFGFPITYTRMMEAGALEQSLDSVRIWGTTADASHEVQQRAFIAQGSFFTRLGIPVRGSLFVDGLGSSEVGIAALLRIATPWTKRFERRVGRKTPLGPMIKIADADGRPVAKGQVGRLMIKGKSMFDGYWNAHDVFYASTRDGWWFTGDMMREGSDGEFVHLDREVDVIHTAGGPVYTLPLEEVILKHEGVLDTCVFGVRPTSDGPEVTAAVVAPQANANLQDAEALRRSLNALLPAEQQLVHLWLIDWQEFPIGATGKTLKRRLRERYNSLLQPSQIATGEEASCRNDAVEPA
ncbi:class I adenylate-forming enzyme family protein [Microbulbifer variabilis]|uniref:class I adenylate-forming enzyme family protein n=1 Tax=Microbulbifer variabilis TaxID=266805 RepID=UPI001CFD718C|nr:class I adenylate-forming enzyme family protein [Microbulbifer variabilis]